MSAVPAILSIGWHITAMARVLCTPGCGYPVRLLYFEWFDRVDDAYRREKQVQGWGRAKRLALVKEQLEKLPGLSRKAFPGP